MEVHQFMTGISYGDAVSNDAITMMHVLRKNGFDSNIYAKYIHPRVANYAKPINKYESDGSNIAIYQFCLAGEDVTDFVCNLTDIKILRYHNITPPEFFRKYDLNLEYSCSKGLRELESLYKYFHLGLGVSEFNRRELVRYGFSQTDVLPIFYDFDRLEIISKKEVQSNDINILFVGRISPNKKQEDIIKVFYYYHKFINENSKLTFVGDKQITAYMKELEQLIQRLELDDAVIFTGLVSDQQLNYYYSISDIFISMSEHEGFCVPLLEAMRAGISILAYDSSGIPYTLGSSGILIKKKNYREIAELIQIIIEDNELRNRIVERQKKRLSDFSRDIVTKKLLDIINDLKNISSAPN
jgi:L-malate glycosyltransferase